MKTERTETDDRDENDECYQKGQRVLRSVVDGWVVQQETRDR